MRIVCASVEDFLENLKDVLNVYNNTVYVSVVRRPYAPGPLPPNSGDATRFEVILQCSTVVMLDDGTEFLLDMAINCGFDRIDDSPEEKLKNGTWRANRSKIVVSDFAAEKKWKILPGVISE